MYTRISIHAPTRGATCSGHKIFYTGSKFQSTLPRGERHVRVIKYSILVPNFNPRSHEGSDVCIRVAGYTITYFNPRSHEGSDFSWGSIAVMYTRISIHAPTRGATLRMGSRVYHYIFQSTLPRGERLGAVTS